MSRTEDRILGGRVLLAQPAAGYRAALDPVLLAAAAQAKPGDRALDLGTGAGAAALCLLARVPGTHVTGIEIDPASAALARHNAAANGVGDRFTVIEGDLTAPGVVRGTFDLVLANPPFHAEGAHRAPRDPGRAQAHVEPSGALAAWLLVAVRRLRTGGELVLIHKADRLADVLSALPRGFGAVRIRPLHPRADAPANRILLRAAKGRRTPLALLPPLVVHDADGRFMPDVAAALANAAPLAS